MKLSIIIPYYNVKQYTDELLSVLNAQMSDDVEVILVDDGSPEPYTSGFEWLTVIWIKHGGPSKARNAGLNICIGEYITFIDSDDIVAKDYIETILKHIEKDPDYIDLSWKSLTPDGAQFNCRVSNTQALKNPSVCTRVYKRSFIGDLRFNENKDIAEDEEFTRRLNISQGQRDFIGPYMYFYRTTVPGSLTKRYKQGLTRTKRIIYNIPVVDPDRTDLLEEIKKEDKQNEVILFTTENNLPELSKYCQISVSHTMWAHELRGEPCNKVEIMKTPLNTQVVIYITGGSGHDGISTFIFNFCSHMKEFYDIAVVHDYLAKNEINRLRPIVRVIKRGEYPVIKCDTLLMMRIADNIPDDVQYKKMYQVVHCTADVARTLKRDQSECVFVSETSRNSFDTTEGRAIYNLNNPTPPEKALILMSTSRIGAPDKGDQDRLMISFAEKLNRAHISCLWFYFSVNDLHGAPPNMIRLNPVDDVRGFLSHADYLIHLSENEAYCFSITEAISMGVPVITLDIPVIHELGFTDGKHGYIINDSFDLNRLQDIPKFKGFNMTDDDKSINAWCDLLGDTVPMHDYIPEKMVMVRTLKTYKDIELDRTIAPDETFHLWKERADYLKQLGLVEIIGG